jgi:16S rRNA pseudouridine516 synthase
VKLDRLLAKHDSMGRNRARQRIVGGEAKVDGKVVTRHDLEIDRFQQVEIGDDLVQAAGRRLYLMLHKPIGVVSATVDEEHRTVIDLIDDPDKGTLHIAGRLDLNTSGLVLLTNDGRWSKRLMDPERKVDKTYLVETRDPIPSTTVEAFAAGFYFHTENLTTRPARLEILADRKARLTLQEGKYHQIKRMFHRVENRVTTLHRERIGPLFLPPELAPGGWRALTLEELELIRCA